MPCCHHELLARSCCREGGYYPLTMEFSEDYPAKPPKARSRLHAKDSIEPMLLPNSVHQPDHVQVCGGAAAVNELVTQSCVSVQCKFDAGFFHPNVYPSGTVCLSILNEVRAHQQCYGCKQYLP
jgi:ubiquitin-conjugating enzyme E2 I